MQNLRFLQIISLALAIFLFSLNSFAIAAQPDYRLTKEEYSRLLAESEDYRNAEKELEEAYKNLLKTLDKSGKKALKSEQVNWIIEKEKRAYEYAPKLSKDYIEFLTAQTKERAEELKGRLSAQKIWGYNEKSKSKGASISYEDKAEEPASNNKIIRYILQKERLRQIYFVAHKAVVILKSIPDEIEAIEFKLTEKERLVALAVAILLFIYIAYSRCLFTRVGWPILLAINVLDISSLYVMFKFFKAGEPFKTYINYLILWFSLRIVLFTIHVIWVKIYAQRLLVKLGAELFEYSVKVFPDKTINAFAYRSKIFSGKKYIGITTKALKRLSKNEMNFVIAHELSHHVKDHQIVHFWTGVIYEGISFFINHLYGLTRGSLLFLLGSSLVKSFIYQRQEYAADENAYYLLKEAGLNTKGGIKLMKRFYRLNKEQEDFILAKVMNFISGTHPFSKDRLKKLENLHKEDDYVE